jgi:hypothetical protein
VIESPQKTDRGKKNPIQKDDNKNKFKNGWYEPAAGLQKQTKWERQKRVSKEKRKKNSASDSAPSNSPSEAHHRHHHHHHHLHLSLSLSLQEEPAAEESVS